MNEADTCRVHVTPKLQAETATELDALLPSILDKHHRRSVRLLVGARRAVPLRPNNSENRRSVPYPPSSGRTNHPPPGTPVWQRNYHEHVVRNEAELTAIREYIQANPARWDEDENNPACLDSG